MPFIFFTAVFYPIFYDSVYRTFPLNGFCLKFVNEITPADCAFDNMWESYKSFIQLCNSAQKKNWKKYLLLRES